MRNLASSWYWLAQALKFHSGPTPANNIQGLLRIIMLSLFQKGASVRSCCPYMCIFWQSDPGRDQRKKEEARTTQERIIWATEHGAEWHLNYSSLQLINAREECPGNRGSGWFCLQLKGLPIFSLRVFIPLHFPTYPGDGADSQAKRLKEELEITLKVASRGRPHQKGRSNDLDVKLPGTEKRRKGWARAPDKATDTALSLPEFYNFLP